MPLSVNNMHTPNRGTSSLPYSQCVLHHAVDIYIAKEGHSRIKTTGKYCPLFPECDKVPAARVGSSVTSLSHQVTQESHMASADVQAQTDIGGTSSCMF